MTQQHHLNHATWDCNIMWDAYPAEPTAEITAGKINARNPKLVCGRRLGVPKA